jgi:putative transposase
VKTQIMANTYTQIHIHAVFAVRNRDSFIKSTWKDDLYKYITGIIQNQGHKLLIINGMPDHLHVLFGMRPIQSLSDLMQDIKGSSSAWINKMNFSSAKFSWQEGYGAFSYSKSQLPGIIQYIDKQEEHHKKKTFIEEYKEFLEEFGVEYNKKYIFLPII